MKTKNLGISFLIILLFVLAGFFGLRYLWLSKEIKITRNIREGIIFAKYEFRQSQYSPKLSEYKIELPELSNLEHFEKAYKQKFDGIRDKHFFITWNLDKFYSEDPNDVDHRYDDWTHLYRVIGGDAAPQLRQPENAVFITTDFLLHVYHRLLEKEFEYIEQRVFFPKLKKISNTLLDYSIKEYNRAGNNEQEESLGRLITYFAVPSVILNAASEYHDKEMIEDNKADSREAVLKNLEGIREKIPPASFATARQELELLLAAEKATPSPLLGKYQEEQGLSFPEDYTQFGPRSHYNKNPVLRTYFRAMMWYGRMNFLLKSPQLTRDAANITLLLEKAGLIKDWEDIYLTTTFFVGESDDLGPYEYRQVIKEITLNDSTKVLNNDLIIRLQNNLKDYRNPQILSSAAFGDKVLDLSKEELQKKTKGFRFMGQRFTPDAFMFSYLTQGQEKPDPKTGERLPSRPTALMVMSILGSKTAEPLLAEWARSNAPDSQMVLSKRMAELNKYFSSLTLENWTKNIYGGWLYTIQSLFQESKNKNGYPVFMKSNEWNLKNLQCSLGSWTELKHDTLLYAKQVYAEMGNGDMEKEIPPVPKGYVEPNIDFFDRFIPLIKMTKEGLEQRNLLDNIFLERNSNLLDAVEFFRKIAVAELQNEKISDDDFERLRLAPGNLGWLLSPLPGEESTENYARAALIADVHTDTVKGEVLYEAVGIPNYIYVAVKDQNGARLTKGLVYSCYEFTWPLGQRLTDEKWREWNYTEDKSRIPSMAEWSKSLIK